MNGLYSIMMTETVNFVHEYNENDLCFGNWRCEGDGIISRSAFFEGVKVGTEYYNNGAQGGDIGRVLLQIDVPIAEAIPDELFCPNCNDFLCTIDEQYVEEAPYGSQRKYEQLIEECCCCKNH